MKEVVRLLGRKQGLWEARETMEAGKRTGTGTGIGICNNYQQLFRDGDCFCSVSQDRKFMNFQVVSELGIV